MKTDQPEPQQEERKAAGANSAEIDANWAPLHERTGGHAEPANDGGSTPPSETAATQVVPTASSENAGAIQSPTPSDRVAGVLVPGSKFGVYVVGECIGEGGMARIYQAEHAGLRRQVALKVLTGNFARDPDGWERFVREGRIAAQVKHPNVVNIFDVGIHEGIPYLVMELLEGTDLESLVDQKGMLDEGLILDIMVPVVAGLAAVHDAGIVHRDLKPGNIFLSKGRYGDIEPKLLDFGISKANDADQLKLTTQGFLIGTPFYMAPEGFRGEEVTPRSDQYSLGIMMYECATGHGPFAASTLPELVRAVTSGQIQPLALHNPNVSARLQAIIERCISFDPEQRYADLRGLGRDLLKLAGQRTRITWGLSFGVPHPTEAAPEPTPEPSRPQSLVPLIASIPPPAKPFTERRAPLWLLLGAFGITLFCLVLLLARQVLQPEATSPAPAYAVAELATSTSGDSRAGRKLEAAAQDPESASRSEPASTALTATPHSSLRAVSRSARPRSAPASPRVQRIEDVPDWVLPLASSQAQVRAPRGETSSGTNGAPIFD